MRGKVVLLAVLAALTLTVADRDSGAQDYGVQGSGSQGSDAREADARGSDARGSVGQGSPAPTVPTGQGDTRHLTPAMARAVRRATREAARSGIFLEVTSGWRSRQHQADLFDAAVAKYGSERSAGRWVLPPGQSEHERGRAIDVGPAEAAAWLEEHGARFGLCRRYDNEPWHFELLARARGSTCPPRTPHAVAVLR